MNLPRWAVGRPVAVTMLILASLLAGWLSLSRLNLELLPQLSLPYAVIATLYPNADPVAVEQEVTSVIEGAAAATTGVQRVDSFSVENASFVVVQFHWGTDMERALEEIRTRLGTVTLRLPAEARPPVTLPVDPSQLPVMIISLAGGDLQRLTDLALDVVQPQLEQLPGVGQANVLGGLEREVEVLYHSDRLRENSLTPALLHQLITLQHLSVPAGSLESDGVRYTARVGRPLASVEELAQLVIGEAQNPQPTYGMGALVPQVLRLQDVAEVRAVSKPRSGIVRVNGEPALVLQVRAQSGANAVNVSDAVRQRLAQLQGDYPELRFRILHDQADSIRDSLRNVAYYGALGAVLAAGVLLFFLREVRAVWIIASAIPLSVLLTFVGLYASGRTLNLMTVGGIALGTGMVLDNAIIVLENIMRLRRQGLAPEAAAVEGTREVLAAIVSATLTTLAVFLPMAFTQGLAGILFRELGITVSLALAASFLVSVVAIPPLSARLVAGATRPGAGEEDARWQRFQARYSRYLRWCLHRPWPVIGAAVLLSVAAIPFWGRLGLEFLPASRTAGIYLQAFTPPGTPLEETDRRIQELEAGLAGLPGLSNVTVQIGDPGATDLLAVMRGAQANSAFLTISVDKTASSGAQILEHIRAVAARHPDLEVYAVPDRGVGPVGDTLANELIVQVSGPDLTVLEGIVSQLHDRLRALQLFPEVQVWPRRQAPELLLDVDRSRSLLGGLTAAQVGLAVRHALTGEQVATLRIDGRPLPVTVRPHPDELANLDALMDFRVSSPVPIPNGNQRPIRLSNISQPVVSDGHPGIRRSDGQRMMEVRALLGDMDLGKAQEIVAEALKDIAIPGGYLVHFSGIHRLVAETMEELGFALLLALVIVFMVLAAHFESWRHPLIVMASVPLAGIGALPALWLAGEKLGATAFLGLIMLGGLVVNNGIVLLDYTDRLRREGLEGLDALAAGAAIRLRPILMTALTTLLGLLPLALAVSPGTEMQRPLALALGGGLFSSTLLTLFVVPCLYRVLVLPRDSAPSHPRGTGHTRGLTTALICLLLLASGVFLPAVQASSPEEEAATPFRLSLSPGDPPSRYTLGALRAPDSSNSGLQFRLFDASNPGSDPAETFRLGVQTDWYRPISFIGYRRLQGDFHIHREGNDEAHAFSLQSHNVLGNLEARLELSYLGSTSSFGALPQRLLSRPLFFNAPLTGMYQVRGELREGRNPNTIWVRGATWSQTLGNQLDTEPGPGTLMLTSGAEIRSGTSWLIGTAGIRLSGSEVLPVVRAGARFPTGRETRIEIGVSSATELSRNPALDMTWRMGRERSLLTMLRAEYEEGGALRPSLYVGWEPWAGGTQWQFMVRGTERFLIGVSTTF